GEGPFDESELMRAQVDRLVPLSSNPCPLYPNNSIVEWPTLLLRAKVVMKSSIVLPLVLFAVMVGGCGQPSGQRESTAVEITPVADAPGSPAEYPGLHNVFRLTERLYSGSSPEGEEGFLSLQRLGIKTIISVDGARPEVERARKLGLRYVHLP